MKYKALFLDLDGTTIPNRIDGMPTAPVQKAISEASARLQVCVATSRPLFLAEKILNHLNITGLCIVNDSSQIYDPVRKKFVETLYIESKALVQAVGILKKFHLQFYINLGKDERIYTLRRVPAKACSLFANNLQPQVAEHLIETLTKIPNIAVHKLPSWHKDKLDVSISHAGATKLHGVQKVAKILGIETHEMIGVGDGYNDFPMLMACGLKIAMGNAVPELKAIADFIAPTVDEDGVATVIEKFILV